MNKYAQPTFKGVSSFIRIYEKIESDTFKEDINRMILNFMFQRVQRKAMTQSEREHEIALKIIRGNL